MKKTQLITFFGLGILVIVTVVLVMISTPAPTPATLIDEDWTPSAETKSIQVTVRVDDVLADMPMEVSDGATALSILKEAAEVEEFAIETKSYEGLGVMVESVAGMINGTNNTYWQYDVNGVAPQIGADGYVVQPQDTVRWHFSASEY